MRKRLQAVCQNSLVPKLPSVKTAQLSTATQTGTTQCRIRDTFIAVGQLSLELIGEKIVVLNMTGFNWKVSVNIYSISFLFWQCILN